MYPPVSKYCQLYVYVIEDPVHVPGEHVNTVSPKVPEVGDIDGETVFVGAGFASVVASMNAYPTVPV